MKIGYTMMPGQGDTDLLLNEVAERLQSLDLKTGGIVQINTACSGGGPCDMDVKVLPSGPIIRISQSLGKDAQGCRLDPDALERAVELVNAGLSDEIDILIVNKFGKHEASGRGFRDVIAEAASRGIPVVVGLNELNKGAFDDFSAGCAEAVPTNPVAIEQWVLGAMGGVDRVSETGPLDAASAVLR